MVDAFAAETRGRVLTQVGCTWLNSRDSIRMARYAAERGVDGVQVALPFWTELNDDEVLFEDLIECGLQVIQPLEAKSGLDVRRLQAQYGERLTFWGNINVINMASGADEEIEAEIRTKLSPFVAAGGGYIYHSDHSVPPEVSLERYGLVLDLVRRHGILAR